MKKNMLAKLGTVTGMLMRARNRALYPSELSMAFETLDEIHDHFLHERYPRTPEEELNEADEWRCRVLDILPRISPKAADDLADLIMEARKDAVR